MPCSSRLWSFLHVGACPAPRASGTSSTLVHALLFAPLVFPPRCCMPCSSRRWSFLHVAACPALRASGPSSTFLHALLLAPPVPPTGCSDLLMVNDVRTCTVCPCALFPSPPTVSCPPSFPPPSLCPRPGQRFSLCTPPSLCPRPGQRFSLCTPPPFGPRPGQRFFL
eukprot:129340-Chlamydomonas_euryale.AAC.1